MENDGLNLHSEKLRADMLDLNRLADSFGVKMVNAFAGAVIQGRKLSDVLQGLALSLAQTALSAAMKPVGQMLGSLLANVMSGPVTPYARGGIVNSPTLFPMRGGTGLMGEAGPEAIVPLARGPGGRLGVRSSGGGVNVVVNIATPDVKGFQASSSQVSALLARAVARGQRNF